MLPAIQGSPRRRMWGQCCSILIKKGFVTPRSTLGLRGASRGVRKGLLLWSPYRHPGRKDTHGPCVRVVYSLNSLS